MRYGSVCSGIEAASVAWAPLGWQAAFFSEIEKFPSGVLAERWPQIPNLGDMTKFKEWPDANIDVLVGGTPCQAFSVAGMRKGFDDPRGQLTISFLAVAQRFCPRWIVWENVPGVLSLDDGRAFGAFIGGLAELGYGFAWRRLDAQWFGLAQRRSRIFLVGHLGDWRRAAAVLFEPEGLRGDPTPRREKGEEVAPTLSARAQGGGGLGTDFECDGGLIAQCLTTGTGRRYDPESETLVAHALRGEGFDASEDGTGRGTPIVSCCFDETQITSRENRSNPRPGDPSHPLAAGARPPTIAFSCKDHGADAMPDCAPTLRAMGHGESHPNAGGQLAVQNGLAVRRLTPRECERLQGFEDDYTRIKWRGRDAGNCPDGPRYKALGNSMAVPVMSWIGERLEIVDDATIALSN